MAGGMRLMPGSVTWVDKAYDERLSRCFPPYIVEPGTVGRPYRSVRLAIPVSETPNFLNPVTKREAFERNMALRIGRFPRSKRGR